MTDDVGMRRPPRNHIITLRPTLFQQAPFTPSPTTPPTHGPQLWREVLSLMEEKSRLLADNARLAHENQSL